MPMDTAQIPNLSTLSGDHSKSMQLTAPPIENSAGHLMNASAPFFSGDGSMSSLFIEITQKSKQTDHQFWKQEVFLLLEIISEHNPLLARAACFEDLQLVADEHGFVLDEYFRLTSKVKEPQPDTQLSAICAGNYYNCPHPSYSPDHRTLGPEYCTDHLFFDRFYQNDNICSNNHGGCREIRKSFDNICRSATKRNWTCVSLFEAFLIFIMSFFSMYR